MKSCRPSSKPRAPPVTSWPFEASIPMACPLRSTDITPLPRYYQAVRPSASHPYSHPRGSFHLWLLRLHRHQGSHVPYDRLLQVQATCMPDAAPSVSRSRRSFVPRSSNYRGFDIVSLLSTRQWFTFVPLPGGHLTPVFLRGLFLHRSPPLPLGSSSGRWFESCSCKPVRGAFPHQPYSYAKPSNQAAMRDFAHDAIRN
jgi:hypothetical protein